MSNATESFEILAISLSIIIYYNYILHNYFDSLTKLFSDLYPDKFLETLAKLFFPCEKRQPMFKTNLVNSHMMPRI